MENRTDSKVSKKVVLLVVTMASFLTPFMGSSTNIALPSIGKEFSLDAVSLAWVSTAYLLAATVFLLPFGRIADIYGRKRIFQYGILIYTVFSLLSAVSTTAAMLISFADSTCASPRDRWPRVWGKTSIRDGRCQRQEPSRFSPGHARWPTLRGGIRGCPRPEASKEPGRLRCNGQLSSVGRR